jgi:hypothetical protein
MARCAPFSESFVYPSRVRGSCASARKAVNEEVPSYVEKRAMKYFSRKNFGYEKSDMKYSGQTISV